MCIFSGPVERVANTRIFARRASNGRQVLVYQMEYAARRPVAMILPLPVARQASGNAPLVRFVSLKHYPNFFSDMNRAFPTPPGGGGIKRAVAADAAPSAARTLAVETIGDFVASFVPTLADFKRLDKRFVLPQQTWDKIPEYRDYGFAVFQLKTAPQGQSVHPMAFSFASRHTDRLFYPTVHIHDGHVHPNEDFDHELFWQPQAGRRLMGLLPARHDAPSNADYVRPSAGSVGDFMDTTRVKGLIDGAKPGVKARLYGSLKNRDTFIRDGA